MDEIQTDYSLFKPGKKIKKRTFLRQKKQSK